MRSISMATEAGLKSINQEFNDVRILIRADKELKFIAILIDDKSLGKCESQ